MGYIFWDTERIRNTQIYMMAYILVNDKFEVEKKEIIIDDAIDVSHRHSPKRKVEQLRNKSTKVDGFESLAKILIPLLETYKSVCFGKDDFVSLNDQLKIINKSPIVGCYLDIKVLLKENNALLSNLGDAARFLKVEHDAHNPLSDSFVTMQYFKYLTNKYSEDLMIRTIPNKNKILDIIKNGSYQSKGKNNTNRGNQFELVGERFILKLYFSAVAL